MSKEKKTTENKRTRAYLHTDLKIIIGDIDNLITCTQIPFKQSLELFKAAKPLRLALDDYNEKLAFLQNRMIIFNKEDHTEDQKTAETEAIETEHKLFYKPEVSFDVTNFSEDSPIDVEQFRKSFFNLLKHEVISMG